MAEKGIRDRITDALMRMFIPNAPKLGPVEPPLPPRSGNQEALRNSGIYLDNYRGADDPAYREDRPGMQQRLDDMLRGPDTSLEIDPKLAPPVEHMLGVTPPNDRMVVDPMELPNEQRYSSFRYRA